MRGPNSGKAWDWWIGLQPVTVLHRHHPQLSADDKICINSPCAWPVHTLESEVWFGLYAAYLLSQLLPCMTDPFIYVAND